VVLRDARGAAHRFVVGHRFAVVAPVLRVAVGVSGLEVADGFDIEQIRPLGRAHDRAEARVVAGVAFARFARYRASPGAPRVAPRRRPKVPETLAHRAHDVLLQGPGAQVREVRVRDQKTGLLVAVPLGDGRF
ncbi:MAG: hypothetical protein AAGG68_12045, partial [Bacteroidota bacterium]